MKSESINRRRFLEQSAAASAVISVAGIARAQEPSVGQADAKKAEAMVARGIDFLSVKGQAADGSFSKQVGIGVTALAASALLRHGRSPDDPTVAKGLKF